MRDRYVFANAAAATWQNVDVVAVQLLAIGYGVVDEEDRVYHCHWQAAAIDLEAAAAHPGVISGFVMLVAFVSCISEMLTLLHWRKVQLFYY